MKTGGKLFALIVVGVVLTLVAAHFASQKAGAGPRGPSSGPPADAEYVSDSPPAILVAVGPARRNGGGDDSAYVGKWVPDSGWTETIEEITAAESGGTALRFLVHDPKIIGGSYWIIAVVGDDHGCTRGQTVRFQGKIKEVSMKTGPALTFINRIVLEDARVLK